VTLDKLVGCFECGDVQVADPDMMPVLHTSSLVLFR